MFKLPITFGKKKEAPPHGSATSRVQTLSKQGFSEPEIIRSLRTEGYSPQEAETAMKDAVRTAALPRPAAAPPQIQAQPTIQTSAPSLPSPQQRPADIFGSPAPERLPGELPPLPGEYNAAPPEAAIPATAPLAEEEEFLPPVGRKTDAESRGDVEEIAEGLVDEKWGLFEKEIEDFEQRLNKIEERLHSMESTMSEFKGVKKGDVEQIKTSIDSYRDSIDGVSERIEAMEHAVKDSLTPMMQSLRSLSDTLKAMKSGK